MITIKVLYSNNYIIKFKNGDTWHFYSKDKEGIFYRNMKGDGIWSTGIGLVQSAQKDFSLCIDEADNLHLIYLSYSGEIIYMVYNGIAWLKRMLFHFDPSKYIIKYPYITIFDSSINIILVIGNNANTGFWSIYHYYYNGNKWINRRIAKLVSGEVIHPYSIDIQDGCIYLVYRNFKDSRYQIYYTELKLKSNDWTVPINISDDFNGCSMPSILVKDELVHVVWISTYTKNTAIKYKNKIIWKDDGDKWEKEATISKYNENCSHPIILWTNEYLYCIWQQNDALYFTYSMNKGESWCLPKILDWPYSSHYELIGFYTGVWSDMPVKFSNIFCYNKDKYYFPIIHDYIESIHKVHTENIVYNENKLNNILILPNDKFNFSSKTGKLKRQHLFRCFIKSFIKKKDT